MFKKMILSAAMIGCLASTPVHADFIRMPDFRKILLIGLPVGAIVVGTTVYFVTGALGASPGWKTAAVIGGGIIGCAATMALIASIAPRYKG